MNCAFCKKESIETTDNFIRFYLGDDGNGGISCGRSEHNELGFLCIKWLTDHPDTHFLFDDEFYFCNTDHFKKYLDKKIIEIQQEAKRKELESYVKREVKFIW